MLYIIKNNVGAFQVNVYVNAGAVTEPKSKQGISHMLEHMMFRTTKTKEVMEGIGRIGATINAVTDTDSTYYYIESDVAFYKQALNFIMSLVFDAEFSASELHRERNVVFEEMYRSDDDGEGKMIWDISNLTVLPADHLYMRNIIGTKESLESITVSDLNKYYKKHYHEAIVIVNCPSSIAKSVEVFFTEHLQDKQLPTILPQIDNEYKRKVVIYRKAKEQSLYVLTFLIMPERPTLKLRLVLEFINHMLSGARMNSLLLKELREKRGLVYTPHSSVEIMKQLSFLKIVIFTACNDAHKIMNIILNIIRMIKSEGFAKTRFSYYKQSFFNNQKTLFQSAHYTTAFFGDVYKNMVGCHERTVEYLSAADVLSTIKGITHDDVVKVMTEHLSLDKLGVFAVGDFDKPQALATSILGMLDHGSK
jgi:predicted Zn-dependent peptidase